MKHALVTLYGTVVGTRRVAVLLLEVLVGLGIPACANVTAPAQPSPTATATPASFHALIVAGTAIDALDPGRGTLLWSRTLESAVAQAPDAAGGVIGLSTTIPSTQPPEGRVVALAAQTGTTMWQKDLGADTQGSVRAAGNVFILATSAVSTEAPNAPSGVTVSALHPADGATIWRHTLPDTDLISPTVFSAGTLFVLTGQFTLSDMNYTLTAFDVASGSHLWQKALGAGTILGSAAGDGGVYISMFTGHIPAEGSTQPRVAAMTAASAPAPVSPSPPAAALTAYRASDGAQLWRVSGFTTARAEVAGIVYATTALPDASGATSFSVTAYRATSGTMVWQSGPLGAGDLYQDKPIIAADAHRVYVFNMPETPPSVHALDGATGHAVWSVPLTAHVAARLAALDKVFVGTVAMPPDVETMKTSVMTLDGATGAMGWTHEVAPSASVGLVAQ